MTDAGAVTTLTLSAVLVLTAAVTAVVTWALTRAQFAARAARLEASLSAATEKNASLQQADERMRDTFRALSQDALNQNSEALLRLARASLGEYQVRAAADLEKRQQTIADLVRPIADTLKQVDGKLTEVERDRVSTTARLDEQIRSLGLGLTTLTGETGALVKALRQPHVRGHWGEIQLRRVVELAGLTEHCDFAEQTTISTQDGRIRPDVIVRLPGGKTVVVDAKAPLSAYLEALDGDESQRAAKLVEHGVMAAKSLNSRICTTAGRRRCPSEVNSVLLRRHHRGPREIPVGPGGRECSQIS